MADIALLVGVFAAAALGSLVGGLAGVYTGLRMMIEPLKEAFKILEREEP